MGKIVDEECACYRVSQFSHACEPICVDVTFWLGDLLRLPAFPSTEGESNPQQDDHSPVPLSTAKEQDGKKKMTLNVISPAKTHTANDYSADD